MSISAINTINNYQYNPSFAKKKIEQPSQKNDENPISRKGEAANLVKATFLGGLALAGKLVWELVVDGDFEFENVAKKAGELVDKNKKDASKNDKSKISSIKKIATQKFS